MSRLDMSNDELVERFPGEPITHDNKAHYLGRLERRLLINRCDACGTWHHPPRSLCAECWSSDVTATVVSGAGTIALAIFLHQGPPAEGVDYSAPYPVVTVDLDDAPGARFTATVVDAPREDIVIGARVALDWTERHGSPMPVFRIGEIA
ncbi:zinc ribbon domain-containing protein [Mycobacterium sp.]|uniref:Zn-ribbon domain-containing OB-fold protein n=1 Tax=Mycobacterium sp. TaxID=1785 RepID=UPI0012158D7B|nr:zinc ribbon domain-containing protein [Mycobacterium sp.]TAM65159.1 MAG: hypothetical protein EPN51_20265 [Mycobacterium sp.]